MHNNLILGSLTYVHFQVPNYPLNDIILQKIGCSHKLQTISNASSHILSIFMKVTFAIKFALKWLSAPLWAGAQRSVAGTPVSRIPGRAVRAQSAYGLCLRMWCCDTITELQASRPNFQMRSMKI